MTESGACTWCVVVVIVVSFLCLLFISPLYLAVFFLWCALPDWEKNKHETTNFEFQSLGISVHCLAVFCLCHHFRFPGGHRHHFLLLRQIEMIKWQIGTHTQLEFSQFETDACPASGRAWITAGCSIIHNDKHTILFSLVAEAHRTNGIPGECDPLPIAMTIT